MARVLILNLAASSTYTADNDLTMPVEIRNEAGSVIKRVILARAWPTRVELPDDFETRGVPADEAKPPSGLAVIIVATKTYGGQEAQRRLMLIGRFSQHTVDFMLDVSRSG
ncbi:hypothetical protein [Caballeronia sp. GAWG2-1]|uniref:hypothetical protein n=1 Tax=Caballeronia sp. GAWG2-1 TaxID=2921744 RepID=UPI00202950B3|nr:hypothetical protein [Caballeronia sp. GAWG2-1]